MDFNACFNATCSDQIATQLIISNVTCVKWTLFASSVLCFRENEFLWRHWVHFHRVSHSKRGWIQGNTEMFWFFRRKPCFCITLFCQYKVDQSSQPELMSIEEEVSLVWTCCRSSFFFLVGVEHPSTSSVIFLLMWSWQVVAALIVVETLILFLGILSWTLFLFFGLHSWTDSIIGGVIQLLLSKMRNIGKNMQWFCHIFSISESPHIYLI